MRKKFQGKLPLPQLKSKLKFEEKVFCGLRAAATGKKEDTCTPDEKAALMTPSCVHEQWPTFWPQCMACVMKKNPSRVLVDKKGREFKVSTTVNLNPLTEGEIDSFLQKVKLEQETKDVDK